MSDRAMDDTDIYDQLRTEQTQLNARLTEVNHLILTLEKVEAQARDILTSNAPINPPIPKTRVKSAEVVEFENAVIEIFREAERPLQRQDVLDALLAKGFHINGNSRSDKLNITGTRLSRMKQLYSITTGKYKGYALKGDT